MTKPQHSGHSLPIALGGRSGLREMGVTSRKRLAPPNPRARIGRDDGDDCRDAVEISRAFDNSFAGFPIDETIDFFSSSNLNSNSELSTRQGRPVSPEESSRCSPDVINHRTPESDAASAHSEHFHPEIPQ